MTVIYETSAAAQTILDSVLNDGVAGIRGGRVAVREKLAKVAALADATGHESIHAVSAINHRETELAFPYDTEQLTHTSAQKAVLAAFVP